MANEKILVIEDKQMNMILVGNLLRLEGYHVLEAVDAETAIPMARKNTPDLILMNILKVRRMRIDVLSFDYPQLVCVRFIIEVTA